MLHNVYHTCFWTQLPGFESHYQSCWMLNQRHGLEESGQRLENIDRTHLVLVSGKPVLQKKYFNAARWPLNIYVFLAWNNWPLLPRRESHDITWPAAFRTRPSPGCWTRSLRASPRTKRRRRRRRRKRRTRKTRTGRIPAKRAARRRKTPETGNGAQSRAQTTRGQRRRRPVTSAVLLFELYKPFLDAQSCYLGLLSLMPTGGRYHLVVL